jgi:hypothetical protein
MHRLLLMVGALACSSPPDPEDPHTILDNAIQQAGGDAALAAASALSWDGNATVFAGGRKVDISGRWQVQPPDTAIVATYDTTRGPSTTRSMVIAAPRGWVVRNDSFTPLPDPVIANERDAFFLYDVIRLVPLRDSAVRLSRISADSLGQRGFRAEHPGRPAVELFVDSTGRLSHIRLMVADPGGGPPVRQDAWLDGELASGGIRWPERLRLTMNGEPYFDLRIRDLKVSGRIGDPLLSGPKS